MQMITRIFVLLAIIGFCLGGRANVAEAIGRMSKAHPRVFVTGQRDFDALNARALKKAGEHLDAIRAGLAQVAPATLRQQNACQYCDWRPICLFDERLDGGCVRRFETIRADEVLERLKLEE